MAETIENLMKTIKALLNKLQVIGFKINKGKSKYMIQHSQQRRTRKLEIDDYTFKEVEYFIITWRYMENVLI